MRAGASTGPPSQAARATAEAEHFDALLQHSSRLLSAGKFWEVLAPAEQALAWFSEQLPIDDRSVNLARANLASAHDMTGAFELARELALESIEALDESEDANLTLPHLERQLGPTYTEVLSKSVTLAAMWVRLGRCDLGREVYARILPQVESAYGKDAAAVGTVLNGLAKSLGYLRQGRHDEAAALLADRDPLTAVSRSVTLAGLDEQEALRYVDLWWVHLEARLILAAVSGLGLEAACDRLLTWKGRVLRAQAGGRTPPGPS